MAGARKDVAQPIAAAISNFEQRCVRRNPKLVQVKTMGSLLIARSFTTFAPIERKRLGRSPGSLRFARAKLQHLLEAKRPVLGYIIEKSTGSRVTPRDIFVHSDYSAESGWWTDVFILEFERATEEA